MTEIEALYSALSEPLGIVLTVSDFTRAQARLYAARQKTGDESLNILQLRRSPYGTAGELWIVKAGQHQLQRPDTEAQLEEPKVE